MCLFSTLYKVDPKVVDECTEEVTLERIEEKCIRLKMKRMMEKRTRIYEYSCYRSNYTSGNCAFQ